MDSKIPPVAKLSEEYTLLNLIRRYTVSTIMILPLFNDDYIIKNKQGHNLLFSQLLLAHGLNNCYLCFKGTEYYLIVEVPPEDSEYPIPYLEITPRDINHFLLINPNLYGVKKEKFIRYLLKIPDVFQKDINIIINSNYSKLSNLYKERIKVKFPFIGKTPHNIANQIAIDQVPFYISIKEATLREAMSKELQHTMEEDLELYEKFNLNKELRC